jgi:hypothetical protein
MLSYTPFNDFNDRYVGVKDGYLYVSTNLSTDPFTTYDDRYGISVHRDSTYPDEAFDFHNGNIAGVMQKVGDKAYWGLEFFRDGTGSGENGGYIKNRVGHPPSPISIPTSKTSPCRTGRLWLKVSTWPCNISSKSP